ncbi:MAG: tetraprenyl-beta-curcumene synthase family protein [Syntrophomonas sp.]|nr:tetraprenyl-beta-curcumene synthase family protein [Syntrophomonas sp.]
MISLELIAGKHRAEHIYGNKISSNQSRLLFHYITKTLPQVRTHLQYWANEAAQCVDEELRRQALNSIAGKSFHCQGGAVFAVPYPQHEEPLLKLIIAYQTLCDYLDNLCDRANCLDGEAFRQLHESLLDALTPGTEIHLYYRNYPYQDDGGYINKMVLECRRCLEQLISYKVVYPYIISLAEKYIDLQVKKHIAWDDREKILQKWAESHLVEYPDMLWHEFAAASGSTLAIFSLLGLATRSNLQSSDSRTMVETYFPWICGLHILLDYFIDQEEDRGGGDLNFTFYYSDQREMINRFKIFIREAHSKASRLPQPDFAKTVIEGLLAMYLTDPKVKKQGIFKLAQDLIGESGWGARCTYHICSIVRRVL